MKVTCFSSFTFAYLNRARVLYSTLRKFHPDWNLVALITDEPPPDEIEAALAQAKVRLYVADRGGKGAPPKPAAA